MPGQLETPSEVPDPAAVFACALSLWQACEEEAKETQVRLSESYNGMEEFMRVVMSVANQFETWACVHVNFDKLNDVWPYFLQDNFGESCLKIIFLSEIASFGEPDCLRIALRLNLPLLADGDLPIPVDLTAENPTPNSPFKKFKIRTMRDAIGGDFTQPYTPAEEPFDDEYSRPYFTLYGVLKDGAPEHIADRSTRMEALLLAEKLAPGIHFVDSSSF